MGPRLNGYWLMTWLGLVANLIALPVIGLLAFREGSSSGIAITNISPVSYTHLTLPTKA